MKKSLTDTVYSLLKLLRSFGCDEFMMSLQDMNSRSNIVSLDTELSAVIYPRRRWEENVLIRGGYVDFDGMFFRGHVTDPLIEAHYIAQMSFPRRAPLPRRIAIDPNFQTPSLELERLPGRWKVISFTSTRKEARRQLFSLTLRRHRGRWRNPQNVTVLTLSDDNEQIRRARIPIPPEWGHDEDTFRAVFLDLEKV
jgi:hypothetical protein